VRVPEGSVRLLRGLPVDLVQDRGDRVEVRFGDPRKPVQVTVSRRAVTNREMPPDEPRSLAPLATVRDSLDDFLQAPAPYIAIETHEVNPSRSIARNYGAGTERADKESFHTKGLTVAVYNYSRRPTGDCQLVVCWLGRVPAGGRRVIGHAESFQVNLEPLAEHKTTSWCQLLETAEAKAAKAGPHFASGSKFDGWIALVTREGRVLTGRGATSAHDEILRDPAQLTPLLATWAAGR
jgi:hypothetical protein